MITETKPQFSEMVLPAKLASLIYTVDEAELRAGATALVLSFVKLFANDECQIMLCEDPTRYFLAIRGTQFSEHTSLPEIWDDVDRRRTAIPGVKGAVALAGFFNPLNALMTQVMPYLAPTKPVVICGHSLGGARALLAAGFFNKAYKPQVYAFAPPRCANAAYWRWALAEKPAPVVVGRLNDFAPAWFPLDLEMVQPGPLVHITADGWTIAPSWAPLAHSVSDHNDELYRADVIRLAA